MNAHIARIARFAGTWPVLLALLAGCGGGSSPPPPPPPPPPPAEIVSVEPAQIEIATDLAFQPLDLHVVLSGATEQAVCSFSSSRDVYLSGGLRDEDLDVTFTLQAQPDLSLGEHTGYLGFYLSDGPGCAAPAGATIRVPYRLAKVYGFATPSAVTLRVGAETTAAELLGSAPIDVTGGPPRTWTARSLTPWLVVDTASGITGGEIRFHADPAGLAGLRWSSRKVGASIEITGDAEGMTSRTLSVTVLLDLPVATAATPPDQPAGTAPRFRLRGAGFTEEALAAGRLAVVGVPGAVFTRLSDQEALVQLPATAPAGTYSVTPPNALGVAPPSAQLRLTAPVETGRAVLAGNGASGHLLWDGLRNALLVLEPPSSPSLEYSNLLHRHVLRDGAWSTTSKNVLMLRRIGFSPDGGQLLAIAEESGYTGDGARGFLAYDPVKLDVVARYTYPNYAPEPPSQAPLAVTFDGWAWFGSAYGVLGFDPANRYRNLGFSVPGSSTYPAHTLASRDGGRLLVSRPYAVAFRYHDASEKLSDDMFHPIAARLTTLDAISDDAGRVLSGTAVYDRDFALVGTLPGPAVLSGDGRRAFTLESRSSWTAGGPAPLVHVFDLTTPAEGGGPLPELGTVDLLDHPTCAAGERTCAPTSSLVVTPDGRVLFAQTAGGVVVVPIPAALVDLP